jgi:hypothetical protein
MSPHATDGVKSSDEQEVGAAEPQIMAVELEVYGAPWLRLWLKTLSRPAEGRDSTAFAVDGSRGPELFSGHALTHRTEIAICFWPWG